MPKRPHHASVDDPFWLAKRLLDRNGMTCPFEHYPGPSRGFDGDSGDIAVARLYSIKDASLRRQAQAAVFGTATCLWFFRHQWSSQQQVAADSTLLTRCFKEAAQEYVALRRISTDASDVSSSEQADG